MAKIDWEKERQRLADLYAGLENSELEKIGDEPESLTDVARETLRAEMLRRGMKLAEMTSREAETSKVVVAQRFRDLPEASIAKSILDSAGVENFLADDNMVRLDWFYSNLVGGIKILVREEDVEVAAKLLAQDVPAKFDVEGVGEYEQPRCPRCQSLDVSFDGLDKRLSYASFFVGVPIPITNRGWKCHSCEYAWKEGSGTHSLGPAVPSA